MKKLLSILMVAAMIVTMIPTFTIFAAQDTDDVPVVTAAAETPNFTVGSAEGAPGDTIVLPITMSENPGITSFRLSVNYDTEILEMTSANTGDLPVATGNIGSDPFVLSWMDMTDHTEAATLMTLTFRIKDDAPVGESKIELQVLDCFNTSFEDVDFETVDGTVKVLEADLSETLLTFTVDSAEGMPGDTVSVQVKMSENTGVTAFKLLAEYDADLLELVSSTSGDLSVTFGPDSDDPFCILWADAFAEQSEAATVATLTFKIKENAPAGESAITLSVEEAYNYDLEAVAFETVGGTVNVLRPAAPDVEPIFTVDTVEGVAGATVNVQVKMSETPGVTAFRVQLEYDADCLELVGHSAADLPIVLGNIATNPYIFSWMNSIQNVTDAKDVINLSFKIKYDAPVGMSELKLTVIEAYNTALDEVVFATVDGGVNVLESHDTHTYSNWTSDGADTHSRSCECGLSETLEHQWNEGEVVKQATPTAAGEMRYTCTVCEQTKSKVIPKLDAEEGDLPTFTADTVTGAQGDTVTVQITMSDNPGITSFRISVAYDPAVLELTAHRIDKLPVMVGNLKTNPYIFSWMSSVSNRTEGATLINLTFKIKDDAPVGSTTLKLELLDCFNTSFEDVAFELVDGTVNVLCNHAYPDGWVSEGENGHTNTCSKCGESEVLAHTWNDGTVVTEATHITLGSMLYECTVCGETKKADIPCDPEHIFGTWVSDGSGTHSRTCICGETETEEHAVINYTQQPATCTAIGWDPYEVCQVCGYSSYVEIPALGHDLTVHEAQDATCTEIGWKAYVTCSRCDHSTYAELAALGHDIIQHEAQAPTCTEIGWEAYEDCSRCDLTTYVEWAATGHSMGEWVVTKEATRTEHGEERRDCANCDYFETQETEFKLAGDVNSDGTLNMRDPVTLQQYLNDWDVVIDLTAADVNADGIVNMKDGGLLQQYTNGWDVELK